MGNKCGIECQWLASKRLIVNPDGQVIPCCFFANSIFVSKMFNYPTKYDPNEHPHTLKDELTKYRLTATETTQDDVLKSYIDQADELNAYNHPIHEIVEHDWFNNLYASWDDSDKVSRICVKHCSDKQLK